MSDSHPGINITVSPSQIGGWQSMTVIFREEKSDDIIRTIEGGNLPVPRPGDTVSFGNIETVGDGESVVETLVDMDHDDYEVVDREYTYLHHEPESGPGPYTGEDLEMTIDLTVRPTD